MHSATISHLSVKNQAQGCFTLLKKDVQRGEPVVLNFDVGVGDATQDCPCKSVPVQTAEKGVLKQRAGAKSCGTRPLSEAESYFY